MIDFLSFPSMKTYQKHVAVVSKHIYAAANLMYLKGFCSWNKCFYLFLLLLLEFSCQKTCISRLEFTCHFLSHAIICFFVVMKTSQNYLIFIEHGMLQKICSSGFQTYLCSSKLDIKLKGFCSWNNTVFSLFLLLFHAIENLYIQVRIYLAFLVPQNFVSSCL